MVSKVKLPKMFGGASGAAAAGGAALMPGLLSGLAAAGNIYATGKARKSASTGASLSSLGEQVSESGEAIDKAVMDMLSVLGSVPRGGTESVTPYAVLKGGKEAVGRLRERSLSELSKYDERKNYGGLMRSIRDFLGMSNIEQFRDTGRKIGALRDLKINRAKGNV